MAAPLPSTSPWWIPLPFGTYLAVGFANCPEEAVVSTSGSRRLSFQFLAGTARGEFLELFAFAGGLMPSGTMPARPANTNKLRTTVLTFRERGVQHTDLEPSQLVSLGGAEAGFAILSRISR